MKLLANSVQSDETLTSDEQSADYMPVQLAATNTAEIQDDAMVTALTTGVGTGAVTLQALISLILIWLSRLLIHRRSHS